MFFKLMNKQLETEDKLLRKTEEAKLTLDILRLVKDGKPIVYEPQKVVVTANVLEGFGDAYKDAGKDNPCILWNERNNKLFNHRAERYYRYVNAWLNHEKDTEQLYLDYVNANKKD